MSNPVERVEIITGRERRRRYSAAEKVRLVEETAQPGMTVSAVARLHGVSPSLLFGWRRRIRECGKTATRADNKVVATRRLRELEGRIRDLECLLGSKTMEAEILREALSAASVQTGGGAIAVAATGQLPVKVMADTLGGARSNLVEQVRGASKPRAATGAGVTASCCRPLPLTDVRSTLLLPQDHRPAEPRSPGLWSGAPEPQRDLPADAAGRTAPAAPRNLTASPGSQRRGDPADQSCSPLLAVQEGAGRFLPVAPLAEARRRAWRGGGVCFSASEVLI
ncbi:transposase [Roseomonas populi]|uniref:transposase n=1 Tax=Roseomonas populi TaxID=3121582 RepID=UPI0038CD442C